VVLDAAGRAVLVEQRAVRVRRAAAGGGAALGVARVLREDVAREAEAAGDRVAARAGVGVVLLLDDLAREGARGARGAAAEELRVAGVAGEQRGRGGRGRGRGGGARGRLRGARALLLRDGAVEIVCVVRGGGGWRRGW